MSNVIRNQIEASNEIVGEFADMGMTVAELRAALEFMEDDAVVLFRHGRGGRLDEQQALPVRTAEESAQEQVLMRSAYSDSGVVISEIGDDDIDPCDVSIDDAAGNKGFVILG